MSFFCCGNSDRVPGRINGNPYHNMCEKACIEVKKVFDACMIQQTSENVLITLTDFTPVNPTYPLTFTSATNSTPRGQITNLEISNTEKPNLSRVRGNVVIPLTVDYVDAQNIPGAELSTPYIPRFLDVQNQEFRHVMSGPEACEDSLQARILRLPVMGDLSLPYAHGFDEFFRFPNDIRYV